MKFHGILLCGCIAGSALMCGPAWSADENVILGDAPPASRQTIGHGHSAIWTLPDVATQYQPAQPTPAMQAALQAQREGRVLDALVQLDNAAKSSAGADAADISLLRASFMLQANQAAAVKLPAALFDNPQYAADAYALTAMAFLQQGKMQEALDAAQIAQDRAAQGKSAQSQADLLPSLALSYALQGAGRLSEARDVMHGFNARKPQSAVALAREAELALTLNRAGEARALVEQAKAIDAAHPYVVAVSGLVYLIDGNSAKAKEAFETALKSDPQDAKALFGLGLAEIRLGNLKAGQEKLQAASDADPDDALVLTYLGRSQQQLGQGDAALASWRSAQQADPLDPIPWLYQAQMELQANRPLDARESLRQAQARVANRSVYRGEPLLQEDAQLLAVNLAEIQRQIGVGNLAFQSLADAPGEKSSMTLRAEADVLQGQRFGESARRSLLLQSLFNERPGTLPAELDVYGDGAGQTGASVPQHGAVSMLNAQQASYNNYDSLFGQRNTAVADATAGSQNTSGGQVRAGAGTDTLGVSVAVRRYTTDGNGPFQNLDNTIGQGIVQWRPAQSTQMFVTRENFASQHGEIYYPADPMFVGQANQIYDYSQVTRFGVRQELGDDSELRALLSHQQTDQTVYSEWLSNILPYSTMPPFFGPTLPFPQFSLYGSSQAHGAELQYRTSGADHAVQLGVQQTKGELIYPGTYDHSTIAQQVYAAWQQALGAHWQLDAQLGWGKLANVDNLGLGRNTTSLKHWLPKLGVVYSPDAGTHVRVAAWQSMDNAAVGNATLAPASVAGFVLDRPSMTYHLVRAVALGADRQLSPSWLFDGSAQQHRNDYPYILTAGQPQQFYREEVDESRLALHWQPQDHALSVSMAYDYERTWTDPTSANLNSVQGQSLRSQQLDLRWFASARWTANLVFSFNQAGGVLQNTFNTVTVPFREHFNQADTSLSWQLNKAGSVNFGVRNAGNTRFQYTNIDPLNPRFSSGRLVYATIRLAL